MTDESQSASQPSAGFALVVGAPERRRLAVSAVAAIASVAIEFDDPYLAMTELCRQPNETACVVLSLHSLYREELQMIAAIKRRFPHVQVWVTDIDGRPAALAEAMRLGIDGLIGEDGLHRLSSPAAAAPAPAPAPRNTQPAVARVQPVVRTNGSANGLPVRNGDAHRQAVMAARAAAASQRNESPSPVAPRNGSAVRNAPIAPSPAYEEKKDPFAASADEPILTADELRALLNDQTGAPISRDE